MGEWYKIKSILNSSSCGYFLNENLTVNVNRHKEITVKFPNLMKKWKMPILASYGPRQSREIKKLSHVYPFNNFVF